MRDSILQDASMPQRTLHKKSQGRICGGSAGAQLPSHAMQLSCCKMLKLTVNSMRHATGMSELQARIPVEALSLLNITVTPWSPL